jgi:hypothetical protein
MTAIELKRISFESVQKEISKIETLMLNEAAKGELKLITNKISDAARAYFEANGFKYRIHLEPGKEVGTSNNIVLTW